MAENQNQSTNSSEVEEAQGAINTASKNLGEAEDKLNQAHADGADDAKLQELQRLVDRLEADNRKLKNESAERRITAKETADKNEQLRKVAQVLGLEKADDDPENLLKEAQKRAEETQREADELRNKLNRLEEGEKLRGMVRSAGGDPEVLVPYLRGAGVLPEWGADDYEAQAAQVVKETLERHPAFVAGKVPHSSGQAPTPVKTNSEGTLTTEDIQRLVDSGDYEAVNKAVAENRIKL